AGAGRAALGDHRQADPLGLFVWARPAGSAIIGGSSSPGPGGRVFPGDLMTSDNGLPATPTTLPTPAPAAPRGSPAPAARGEPPVHRDGFREVVETVVFVTVLVLLLKSFVAEAFVIPTGSMAETLLGDHAFATCE